MRCSPILQIAEGFSQQWELVVPSLCSLKPKCSCNAFKKELPVIPPTTKRKNTPTLPAAGSPYSFQYTPTGWCPLTLSELTMLFMDSGRVWMWPWFQGGRTEEALGHTARTASLCTCCSMGDPCHCLCWCLPGGFDSWAPCEQHYYTFQGVCKDSNTFSFLKSWGTACPKHHRKLI